MKKIILVGAGGHALSVIDSIHSNNKYEIIGVTDLDCIGDKLLSYEIIGNDNILQSIFDSGVKYAFVTVGSIGNTSLREKLFNMLKGIGFILPPIIDVSSNIGSDVMLGEGVYIGKKTVVNPNSNIGNMSIINTGAIIEHCCFIGEFTHIAPGAVVCGDVKIGARTHVGANATVIQGTNIGDNSIVGAGSIVTNDVPGKVIAYGNPCKVVKNNE